MSYTPEQPNKFQGKQVLINSDRLTFNAKQDSIFLFSNKSIGFSTNGSIHFDTSDKKEGNDASKFILNSPNIYLGLTYDGNLPTEPVILGNKMKEWMIGDDDELEGGLIGILEDILDMINEEISYIAPPSGPTTPNAANLLPIKKRQDKLKLIRKQFKETLSNKVKTI